MVNEITMKTPKRMFETYATPMHGGRGGVGGNGGEDELEMEWVGREEWMSWKGGWKGESG